MEPLNPVAVEARIRELSNQIARGVKILSSAHSKFLDADREYDRVYAQRYFMAEGSVEDRKQRAKLESLDARAVRDSAEVEYQFARNTARSLEEQLRAMQSVGASVRSMYSVAGRGEGA
ncbi:hypothetical protein JY504_00915 [Corynebacterium amycolatum]|uniref:hypothetical protein n=1 Tax=Corynebacterium amycolatum TaxID=43765 RepID=UPI00211A44D0|nr:hypothetical protein [Corynebacterium amycolatum]MCQ9168606.1 hypothetical protein [Corynebacterium amycolatum]MCQ9176061.1 hypothetical protein [Corynebacterium amycolatum]